MNREIKFRAWDDEQKKMWSGIPLNQFFDEMSDLPIMQYTGLKDKNGVEIYEGDIVNSKIFGISEVRYFQNSFVLWDDGSYSRDHKNYLGDNCEVIGNIYENPELLEAQP